MDKPEEDVITRALENFVKPNTVEMVVIGFVISVVLFLLTWLLCRLAFKQAREEGKASCGGWIVLEAVGGWESGRREVSLYREKGENKTLIFPHNHRSFKRAVALKQDDRITLKLDNRALVDPSWTQGMNPTSCLVISQ